MASQPKDARSFPIPLSNGTATIAFDGCVHDEDLETIKKWIEIFGRNVTDQPQD